MKKLFIALIILGGVFTMANAQILRTLEEKEGYYPVVELKDSWQGVTDKAIFKDAYLNNLDLYFNGNVYKAVPISEFIDEEHGWHTNTVFNLNGIIIKTEHPSNGIFEINFGSKPYYRVKDTSIMYFRFYGYKEETNQYAWAGGVFYVGKQKIGNKTYEVLLGSFSYYNNGERLWVRELPE